MQSWTQRRPLRSASPKMPLGLRCLLASLSVSLLASASPGRDEALRFMALTAGAPRDLGNGLTLLSARAEGAIWFQAIGSDAPFDPPDDRQFRAMLRDRCGDEELWPLIARGAVVHEARRFGSLQEHGFTLIMSSAICDQVAM